MTSLHYPHLNYSPESQGSNFIEKEQKSTSDDNVCLAPLHRYVHMNDSANTQIFTFLLLPHLLCGLVDFVETKVFHYAEHDWFVRFERTDTHLGFFLELLVPKYEECENLYMTSTHSSAATTTATPATVTNKLKHKLNKRPTQWKTITVDFEFTIRNRGIFSQNECFSRLNCTFTQNDFKHGRKNVIDLAALSSKRFLFDDGRCIIELGLRNPHVTIKLQANQTKDPTNELPLSKNINRSRNPNPIVLKRMDNTTFTLPSTIHFETDKFLYADDLWMLTIDVEPYRDLSTNLDFNIDENQDLCVDVEVCLVKQTSHRNYNYACNESEKPLGSHWIHLTCNAYLPGECNTGLMDFYIGSHGWPLKAHCCKFDELRHQQIVEQSRRDSLRCDANEYSGKRNKSSALAFLLSTVSSNFSITLEMILYEQLTVVNFPINSFENSNDTDSCIISDPMQLHWRLFMNSSSRLVRLGLLQERKRHADHQTQGASGGRRSPKKYSKQYSPDVVTIPSGYMSLVGCKLRIRSCHSDKNHCNHTIEPVGKEILHIMSTKSDVYEEALPHGKHQHNYTNHVQDNLNIFLIDYLSHNLLKSEVTELWRDLCNSGAVDISIRDSKHLYRKANQISIGQVAMEITRQELTDSSLGLFNSKTGTIVIEIHWLYRHQVYIDTICQTDEIGARQYQQMRCELMRITKEKDELERQLMAFQLGLVQIDSQSQGPKSMLPIESVTSQVGRSRRVPAKVNDDYAPSKRYIEKSESQHLNYKMNDTVPQFEHGYTNQSTRSQAQNTFSAPYYNSNKHKTNKPPDLTLRSHLDGGNRRSSFDYEFSDESIPRSSVPVLRPYSSQLPSSSTGLSEKRRQFISSKGSWKTCEAVRYRPDPDYNHVHYASRHPSQKTRSSRESSQSYAAGNYSPCSTSGSSTSRAFTTRSEHEFSFSSR
ncbi:unnamed protein product [Trichobilharzia szidati]|nr:unnamed protein product [Trichobilharzia szidati]